MKKQTKRTAAALVLAAALLAGCAGQPEDMHQYPVWYLYHDGQLTASRYQYVGGTALDAPRNRIIADAGDYYLVERNFDSPTYALVPKADYWADSDGATDIPIQVQLPW